MILFSVSRAVVGLVRVMELSADCTRCVGSLMKCLAVVSGLDCPIEVPSDLCWMLTRHFGATNGVEHYNANWVDLVKVQ